MQQAGVIGQETQHSRLKMRVLFAHTNKTFRLGHNRITVFHMIPGNLERRNSGGGLCASRKDQGETYNKPVHVLMYKALIRP